MINDFLLSDKAHSVQPAKRIAVWDDHPRFLGMFSSHIITTKDLSKVPFCGFADHLVTCKGCAASNDIHPKLHALLWFVRLGAMIYTVSWPTWVKI